MGERVVADGKLLAAARHIHQVFVVKRQFAAVVAYLDYRCLLGHSVGRVGSHHVYHISVRAYHGVAVQPSVDLLLEMGHGVQVYRACPVGGFEQVGAHGHRYHHGAIPHGPCSSGCFGIFYGLPYLSLMHHHGRGGAVVFALGEQTMVAVARSGPRLAVGRAAYDQVAILTVCTDEVERV